MIISLKIFLKNPSKDDAKSYILLKMRKIINQITKGFAVVYCNAEQTQIKTAIGCITGDTKELFATLLRFAIGIAGGIAFLLIIFGGLRIILSSGNPEGMMEGKEIVTAAIVGLLMIIFSVFILRFIGVDVLKIPGFS